MSETPAERISTGRGTPGDVASFDQARAEAAEDLQNLREAFAAAYAACGPDRAQTAYVNGLVAGWSPLSVASVFVEAMRQMLEKGERCP